MLLGRLSPETDWAQMGIWIAEGPRPPLVPSSWCVCEMAGGVRGRGWRGLRECEKGTSCFLHSSFIWLWLYLVLRSQSRCCYASVLCFQVNSYIEDCIAQKHPLIKVLRLICLQSVCNSGLKQKVLDYYKREILQVSIFFSFFLNLHKSFFEPN